MAHDIKVLERRVRSLGETISKIYQNRYDESLIVNMHGPGWTTIRENELVLAHLDMLQTQANALSHGLETLVGIADKIGRSELNPQPLPPG